MPPSNMELTSEARAEDLSKLAPVPMRRKGRSPVKQSLFQRRVHLLVELGWLTLAMTVQLYVPEAKGYWVVFGLLAAYLLVYIDRANKVPNLVWLLSLGLSLGSLGGLSTGSVTDLYSPLHLGLSSLAIMGFFVGKYNRDDDARLVALVVVVLLPLAAWQSINRNGLADEWEEGGRRGVNLIALFLMLAGSYGLLLKGLWKLVALPIYAMLFLLGSRTAFITALALPIIFYGVDKTMRRCILGHIWTLFLVVGVVFTLGIFNQYLPDLQEHLGGAMGEDRLESDALQEGADQRLELSSEWFQYLLDKPTLFGHGVDTYTATADYDRWAHEGFLHVFNGFGVICGFIYLWVCIRVPSRLWRKRERLPTHISWAGAFFAVILLRALGEAQLIVHSVHMSGFAITYATGLAIWGAERYGQKASTRNKSLHGRIQSKKRPVKPRPSA